MVKYVKFIKRYNLFLLTSIIARNVLEIFSIIFLYEKNFDIKNIIFIYLLIYLMGIIINVITLKTIEKINFKYILFISNILFIFTIIYLNGSDFNIYLYIVLYSLSTFSFHAIRHYLALLIRVQKSSNIVLIMFISLIISSIIAVIVPSNYIYIVLIIFLLISLLILLKINDRQNKTSEKMSETYKKIKNNKKKFFILEQAKILYLIFEPLYLYLYVNDSIKYVGVFYCINAISSLVILYFVFKKKTYFKYSSTIITILSIVLLFKLNINNANIILITGILEGILFKIYESYSVYNLYNIENISINNYLIINETIFGLTRVILCLIFILVNDIKIILYILIFIIYLSQFVKLKEKN